MADTDKPCTRAEALEILRNKVAPKEADPEVVAEGVRRLQTLSDPDLTALSQSNDTFSIVESNRRFFALLQQEAARTRRLTWWVMVLTLGVFLLTGVLTWRELRRDYAAPTDSSVPASEGSSSGSAYGLPDIAAVSTGRVSPAART